MKGGVLQTHQATASLLRLQANPARTQKGHTRRGPERGQRAGPAGSTWQSWTMVTTGVAWLAAPIDTIMAYSRSA